MPQVDVGEYQTTGRFKGSHELDLLANAPNDAYSNALLPQDTRKLLRTLLTVLGPVLFDSPEPLAVNTQALNETRNLYGSDSYIENSADAYYNYRNPRLIGLLAPEISPHILSHEVGHAADYSALGPYYYKNPTRSSVDAERQAQSDGYGRTSIVEWLAENFSTRFLEDFGPASARVQGTQPRSPEERLSRFIDPTMNIAEQLADAVTLAPANSITEILYRLMLGGPTK